MVKLVGVRFRIWKTAQPRVCFVSLKKPTPPIHSFLIYKMSVYVCGPKDYSVGAVINNNPVHF